MQSCDLVVVSIKGYSSWRKECVKRTIMLTRNTGIGPIRKMLYPLSSACTFIRVSRFHSLTPSNARVSQQVCDIFVHPLPVILRPAEERICQERGYWPRNPCSSVLLELRNFHAIHPFLKNFKYLFKRTLKIISLRNLILVLECNRSAGPSSCYQSSQLSFDLLLLRV